ncbi:septation protein SepH [Rothia sp. P6271]|uniref:septation protein SepH n=1 Tax=Rothia sp. P6271 TaxID=3402659 RepID=UPI003AC3097E
MLELRLSGIHDDGEHLVLESVQGERYILPIDQNLRTSIAKARRIQPLRGRPGNGVFGPRDIQARFRQGASVEQIVEESGWEAERVRRYEWPIIAERAHIIAAARAVRISPAVLSHGRSDAPALSLDELMERVGEKFNLPLDDAQWSTYQQESGQWSISADIELSDDAQQRIPQTVVFPARWTYNPANQSVYASNEAAYFLMERADPEDAPVPGMMSHSQHDTAEEEPHTTVEEFSDISVHSDESELAKRLQQSQTVDTPLEKSQSLDGAGTRDFASASERKLAELLERARSSSTRKSTRTEEALSSSEHREVQESQPTNDETPAVENTSVRENVELQEASTTNVGSSDVEQQHSAADEGSVDSSEPSASDSASNDGASKSESSSSRSKRTSVPSWDDIIFGNQRR